MTELTQHVSVHGRVRFRQPQDARNVAAQLLAGGIGTVFEQPSTLDTAAVRVAGRSLRLSWEGQVGGNDHEHTYMALSQMIEDAEHGAFVVGGEQQDTVFCVMEDLGDDRLTQLVGAVWGESEEIEFLRDGVQDGDLPVLLELWPQLDTWGAKNAALTLLCDFGDGTSIPAGIQTVFRELWATPEPTEFSPDAADHRQELYDFWWAQAWTLVRVLDSAPQDLLDELSSTLTGEARRQRFAHYAAQAQARLGPARP